MLPYDYVPFQLKAGNVKILQSQREGFKARIWYASDYGRNERTSVSLKHVLLQSKGVFPQLGGNL